MAAFDSGTFDGGAFDAAAGSAAGTTPRNQVVAPWSTSGGGTSYTNFSDAAGRTIPAGALVVRFFRWEGGDTTATFDDTAGGTYTLHKFDTTPSIGIAYCWNHPGGAGVVGTLHLGAARNYINSGGVAYDGSDATNPVDGAPSTLVGDDPSHGYTASTAGRAFMVVSEEASISVGAVAPSAVVSLGWGDGGAIQREHSAGANTIAATSTGSAFARSMSIVFKDPPADAIAGPLTTNTWTRTGYTITGFSANAGFTPVAWQYSLNGGTSWSADLPDTTTEIVVTGRTFGTTDNVVVRARDAGAVLSNELSKSVAVGYQEISATGLEFNNLGANITLKMDVAPSFTNFTYAARVLLLEPQPTFYGAGWIVALQNGVAWNGSTDYFMPVPHGADAGTFNATTGQRDSLAASPMWHEIAMNGSLDRIASHASLVGAGETQESYLCEYGVWKTMVCQARVVGANVEFAYYIDWENDRTKVIRQFLPVSGLFGSTLSMYLGTVPWATEHARMRIWHMDAHEAYLTPEQIDAELQNFTDTPTAPSCHFRNVFPALSGGVVTDNKGSGTAHPFNLTTGTAPGAFTETVLIEVPAGIQIDPAASASGATIAGVTISQTHLIGPEPSSSGSTVAGVTVSQTIIIDPAESFSGATVGIVDLVQTHVIAPSASSSGATVADAAFSQTHIIDPVASSSDATVESVAFVQTYVIAPSESSGGATVGDVTILQTHTIDPSASSSGGAVGIVSISQTHQIDPAASSGGATVSDVTFTQSATITPAASSSGATVNPVVFIQGFLGSTILSASGIGTNGPGIMHNDMRVGDDAKRYFFVITRAPTNGTLDIDPIGTFTYTGTSDSFDYELFEDGVSLGEATVTLSFSATEITADPSNSGATVALVVVTQTHVIAPSSSSSGASVASVVFGQTHVINPQPSSSGATVPEVNLTGATQINPEPSSFGANVSDVSFNQTHIITPAASSSGATVPTAVFTQTHVITVQASASGATVADVEFITGDITHIEIEPSSSGATVSLVVVEILEFSLAELRGDVLSVSDPAAYLSIADKTAYLSISGPDAHRSIPSPDAYLSIS